MIIGLTGQLAAGKGTVTKYLTEHHNAKAVKFSQPLRDIVKRLYQEETREHLVSLGKYVRQEFGSEVLTRTLIRDIDRLNIPVAVFDGIRFFDEMGPLRERPDFVLVAIDTDVEKRHQRILVRGENVGDSELSLEQFKQQHQLPTELEIPEIMKQADYTIRNNGTFDELYAQVDEIVSKLK